MAQANQTEASEVRELSGKESGNGSGTPFSLITTIQNPPKRGVPEQILDSFPESSRTSLPDPRFPCFFRFPIFLAFLCIFPLFSKDFRGSAKRKTLAFLGGKKKPLLFPQKSKDWRSGYS